MYATIRRFEGVDKTRTDELVKQVDESLKPKLSELPGFVGYYLVNAGEGVMTSVSFFDTSAHADASTETSSAWVRDQKLDAALPNRPKITSGEIVVQETRELVKA
jgi:antibiotic biosynthesis monooxygenase